MRAEELRIGNTVFSVEKQVPTEIMGLGIQAQKEADMLKKPSPYTPVELSEEWLMKFGFWKREGSNVWNIGTGVAKS